MTDLHKAAQEALEYLSSLPQTAPIRLINKSPNITRLRAALGAPEPAPPFDALRALVETWREKAHWPRMSDAAMSAYHACADELTALIDAAQPKERHSK